MPRKGSGPVWGGMFGGAGVVGLYALGALTAAIVMVLATAMAGWLAALIVAVAYARSRAAWRWSVGPRRDRRPLQFPSKPPKA